MGAESLQLLSRRGCHLCDAVRGPLALAAARSGLSLAELDVDQEPHLLRQFSDRVPVLLWAGQVVAEGRFDPGAALEALPHSGGGGHTIQ